MERRRNDASFMTVFDAHIRETAVLVEAELDRMLPRRSGPLGRVIDAMRHGALDGGKRLRPFLVVASADMFEAPRQRSLRVGCAVEMIHCYSLIHDDLPAMDDSDLRRGRPSVHKAYDDATAILAGDALLTQAFEALAEPATHPDGGVRSRLALELARASGREGMVGGQMMDLEAENRRLTVDQIIRLQRMKTGELFAVSCEAGAILGKAPMMMRKVLRAYAHDMGLAFQITDDILDVEGDTATLGKPQGSDQKHAKPTYPALLGLERAQQITAASEVMAVAHGTPSSSATIGPVTPLEESGESFPKRMRS